ncbi:MAG: pilus assembly protein PilM [Lachnospiraceae bacterium]|nr:pilus assembly protein PilM [Lachnospiraceae bacterium]
MRFLSMDFSSDLMQVYQLETKGRETKVLQAITVNMPQNSYVAGMLVNNDLRVSDLIVATLKEAKIKDKKVVVAVTPTDCMTEQLSLPKAKEKVLDGMVQQELQKRRKLNANYIYDYIVLGEDPLKEGFVKVRAVLCPKALIANYHDVLKKAGLEPLGIDIYSHCMELLADRCGLLRSQDISILACINNDEVNFLYCGKNEEPYYRHELIEQGDALEESMFVLSAATKIDLGFDKDENVINKTIENITRLSRFHSQRHPDLPIKSITVYGNYKDVQTLCDRISLGTGIQAIPFNPTSSISGFTSVRAGRLQKDITSIGLALNMENKVGQYHFFDEFLKIKEGKHHNLKMLPIVIILFIAFLLIVAFQFQKKKNADLSAEIEELEMTINDPNLLYAYYSVEKETIVADQARRYADRGEAYIQKLTGESRFESDYIRAIDDALPAGITINSYTLNNNVITISCSAEDKYLPAHYTEVLSALPAFSNVAYGGFSAGTGIDGQDVYNFALALTIAK